MGDSALYLIFCIVLVVILTVCIIILSRNYLKLMKANDALRESINNLCGLNDKLRMDRHDYLNHLQIVYGLMELEEYDEMNEYLRKVYKELLKTGKAVRTSKPAINALLAAKSAESEAKGIEFVIEVKSDLKNLGIEDWELCKVFEEYGFKGCPIIRGSALKALEDPSGEWGDKILELMRTVDEYFPDPVRETDKPFLMPVEDVFSITGRGTVATGRVEREYFEAHPDTMMKYGYDLLRGALYDESEEASVEEECHNERKRKRGTQLCGYCLRESAPLRGINRRRTPSSGWGISPSTARPSNSPVFP